MEGVADFIGKRVKLVYTDGGRDKGIAGVLKEVTPDGFVRLIDEWHSHPHLISAERVIYITVLNEV